MNVSPQRIQRRRTAGWRMPEGATYVGRPTQWGNPWRAGEPRGDGRMLTAEQAVRLYRRWLTTTASQPTRGVDRAVILNGLHQLRGRDLACWCPLVDEPGAPVPCHADVLLALANGGDRS